MSTPDFPVDLPKVSAYGVVPFPQLIATEAEGPRAVRRRSISLGAIAQVEWIFTGAQYSTFVQWWRDTLIYGNKKFYIELPSAGGITPVIATFDSPYKTTAAGYNAYKVSATLEVLSRALDPVVPLESYSTRVYASANTSAPSGVETPIVFDTIKWTAGSFDPAYPTRLTVLYSGLYIVTCSIRFDVNDNGFRYLSIRQNSSVTVARLTRTSSGSNSGGYTDNTTNIDVSAVIPLVTGEFIDAVGWQDSGSTIAMRVGEMSITRISE